VYVEGHRIVWVRFADWCSTSPLLIYSYSVLAGHPRSLTNILIFLCTISIILGSTSVIIGSYVLKAISGVSFLPVLFAYYGGVFPESGVSGSQTVEKETISKLRFLTTTTWIAYPVVCMATDRYAIIPVNTEIMLYAVLDIMSKAAYGFIVVTRPCNVHYRPIRSEERVLMQSYHDITDLSSSNQII